MGTLQAMTIGTQDPKVLDPIVPPIAANMIKLKWDSTVCRLSGPPA